MVALTDNDVKMGLAIRLVRANPLLEDSLRFFDELAVEIDAVRFDATRGVVFAEDVLGCLAIVVVHARRVGFAFVGELLGTCAITIIVGLSGLCGCLLVLKR